MPPAAEDSPGGQHREEAANGNNGGGFSWLQVLAFLFLTFNSTLALYRSMDDPWNAAFVVLSYAVLLALFYCLRLFETAPSEASRGPLKMWVWVLSAILIVMFTHRVAAIMPLPVAMLVWGLAAATTCGGFYALFVYENEDDTKKNSDKPSKV
ncbi:hypothetical protein Cni_G09045 [Canna indica]|uniref:Uncharacterized protein n=1 Tax=Canna indica TaxID=4628 RepID=A0AAQ3K501_9LILI|nr:hypothetical protein Cni_G09045 [Canna indica]